MKLIIEIPDKVYNEYREGVMSMENDCIIGNAVFDGIPYEERPQGDLISREDIKDHISELMLVYSGEELANAILNAIDNAPTVEPKLKDDIIEAFNLITDQEFEHSNSFWIETPKGKKIEFEKKRPQGEWLFDKENSFTIDMFKCSICGYFGDTHFKFCPDCGADMRKGGAKNV